MYGDFTKEEEARLEAAGVDYDVEAALRENPQDGYTVIDIKKVWAAVNDSADNDYPDYAWVIEFVKPVGPNGETFALLEGSHDYTGWDCQSGASTAFANSTRQAVGLLDSDGKNPGSFEMFRSELLKQINSVKQETWYEQTNKELGLSK